MRTHLLLVLATALLFLGSCTAAEPPKQEAAAPPPPEFKLTGTIKDLMDSVIDPNADVIWESVATTISVRGIEEKYPKTEDEWKQVRRSAIALMEGTNLLLMPGRHVAKPGEKAEDAGVELQPEQIEALINQDRTSWNKLAAELYESVIPVLEAIEKKDPEGVLNTSDAIDRACENCHLKYWYPNEAKNLK